MKIFKFKIILILTLAIVACKKDDNDNNDIALTEITLTTTSLPLEVNSTGTLSATPVPDDMEGVSFRWSVDDAEVLALSSTTGGEVAITALRSGTAVVTVRSGSIKATAEITVPVPIPVPDALRVNAHDFMIYPCNIMSASRGFDLPGYARQIRESDGLFHGGSWGDMKGADDMVKDQFDCGFNMTAGGELPYLPYVKKYNMHLWMMDRTLNEAMARPDAEIVAKGKNEMKALIQPVLNKIPTDMRSSIYMSISDEPNVSRYQALKVWSDIAVEEGMTPYINLFPNYASSEQLGVPSYRSYLNQFVSICRPPYMSYDNYAATDNLNLSDGYYENLETVREVAMANSIPFWQIVSGGDGLPQTNPAFFNIQIYTTMAYGGRGIGYWCYYNYNWGGNNGANAAIVDGKRTKSWYLVRDINMQIQGLAPVFCTLTNVNVFHTGNIPRASRGIASSSYVKSVSAGNFVVGEFVDPDMKPYLLIVNKNTTETVPVELSLKSGSKLMRVRFNAQGTEPFEGLTARLAPGAGVLLKIE
jgi:hypothetical protein